MPHYGSISVAMSRFTENKHQVDDQQARELVQLAIEKDIGSSKFCGLKKGHEGTDGLEGVVSLHSDRFEKEALTTVRYFLQHKQMRPQS